MNHTRKTLSFYKQPRILHDKTHFTQNKVNQCIIMILFKEKKLTSILQISTPARWPAFAKAGSIVVRDRCGDWERDTAAVDTAVNPTSTRISEESAPPP